MIQIAIPINVANVIKYVLVSIISLTVIPDLLTYTDRLDIQRRKRSNRTIRFRDNKRLRIFGVSQPGWVTFLVFLVIQISLVALEYSINHSLVFTTKKMKAITYVPNSNPWNYSDSTLTKAAGLCMESHESRAVEYRPPVLYLEDPQTLIQSSFDRLINGSIASCVGNRLGETVPTTAVNPFVLEVRSGRLCDHSGVISNRTIAGVRLCFFAGNQSNIEAAFNRTERERPSDIHPYFYLTEYAYPSTLWTFSTIEQREYVIESQSRVRMGWTSLFIPVLLLLYIVCKCFCRCVLNNTVGSDMISVLTVLGHILDAKYHKQFPCEGDCGDRVFIPIVELDDEWFHVIRSPTNSPEIVLCKDISDNLLCKSCSDSKLQSEK